MYDLEINIKLHNLGLNSEKRQLSYGDFRNQFDDTYREGRRDGHCGDDVRIVEYRDLPDERANEKIREIVDRQHESLRKAFAMIDRLAIGKVKRADFRRVLDLFCFRLTEKQYNFLLRNNRLLLPDGYIDYKVLLNMAPQTNYLPQPSDKRRPPMRVPIEARQRSLALYEVQENLRASVMLHFYDLARDFAEVDYAKIDVVSKDDFRTVLHKNGIRMTDVQFEKLWEVLSVNDFGNVNYVEFLKTYSNDPRNLKLLNDSYGVEVKDPLALVPHRPQTAMSLYKPHVDHNSRAMQLSRSATSLLAPEVSNGNAEMKLQEKILKKWREIQRQCKLYDPQDLGLVSVYKFRDIIANLDVVLSDDEFHRFILKYDLDTNGRLSYINFLQRFLLTLEPKARGIHDRPRLATDKTSMTQGETSKVFYDAMLRVHDCVSARWKEMRRAFRGIDSRGCGVVTSTDFRRILKQFGIDLSEEEFYQLLTYYDRSLQGHVSYNDFLRAFLKD